MKHIRMILLIGVVAASAVADDEVVQRELEQDVVLRALVDEIGRSLDGLELKDLERPYFIEYGLLDGNSVSVAADLGAVVYRNASPMRTLRTDVRVGSYELDNTNFTAGYGGFRGFFGGNMGSTPMPIEDDYNAIRQSIWWATDRDYKNVVEQLVKKKAFMESKMIEDKPNDFSRETPAVYFEEPSAVTLDRDWLEEMAVTLSAIFRNYPDIKNSGVTLGAAAGNKYLVNTEGTRIRTAGVRYTLSINAEIQAEDGMELSDSISIVVRDPADMPSLDELSRRCREMAERLIEVRDAPVLERAYTGPVLFEPEAAAQVFAQNFSDNFAGGQRPVGSSSSPDDFANKLNRRILPRFINVVDDPTQERIAGKPVLGHYKYDDQGVAAQAVTLVQDGRLKALLMSRNPSKEFDHSNGHGRGIYGPSAAVGCLVVSADPAESEEELREELLDAAQDEGLPYAIRIAALGGSNSNPLVVYKVFADGHEELVRGVELAGIDLKAFKRILAAGDKPYVLNSGSRAGGTTVVTPALLFEELDLAKIDRDFDKPPILKTPLAR